MESHCITELFALIVDDRGVISPSRSENGAQQFPGAARAPMKTDGFPERRDR
jgi:hypothetical protein